MSEKIFIDLDEEIIFIVEKLLGIEGKRAILIIPENASVLGSIVSLKLLFSEVSKTDKDIVIVTEDDIGKGLAEKANFVVVNNISQINNESWEKAGKFKEDFLKEKERQKEILLEERQESGGSSEVSRDNEEKSAETDKKETLPPTKSVLQPKVVTIAGFEMVSGGDISEIKSLSSEDTTAIPGEDYSSEDFVGGRKTERVEKGSLVGRDLSSVGTIKSEPVENKKEQVTQPKSTVQKGPSIASKISSSLFKGGRQKIFIGIFLVVAIFFALSYFVFPKGEVVIKVKSEDIEITEDVVADTSVSSLNLEKLTIPASTIEATRDRSESADATGKKETGEKASGQLTLFNLTYNTIKISAGTVLESIESGRKYHLNSAASVPPRATEQEGGGYGVLDVGVTAQTFGKQFNITDKQEFRVSGYDAEKLYGKNFSNITGGTTEEIKVVSQEDYDNLKDTLVKQLKDDLKESLNEEAGSNRTPLLDSIKYETVNEGASPSVGSEAESFNLSVTLKATALSFSKDDLNSLAEVLVEKENDKQVEVEEFEYSSKIKKTEGEKVFIQLSITGVVTPTVDEENIKEDLANANQRRADEYLSGLEDVQEYEYKIDPSWMPSFLKHFPSSTDRIKVSIEKVEVQSTD